MLFTGTPPSPPFSGAVAWNEELSQIATLVRSGSGFEPKAYEFKLQVGAGGHLLLLLGRASCPRQSVAGGNPRRLPTAAAGVRPLSPASVLQAPDRSNAQKPPATIGKATLDFGKVAATPGMAQQVRWGPGRQGWWGRMCWLSAAAWVQQCKCIATS